MINIELLNAGSGSSSGGKLLPVVQTGNYTAVDGNLVLADATAGPITITLPLASLKAHIGVVKTDSSANAVTIARAGADLITGDTSVSLPAQYYGVELQGDGSTSYYAL